MNVHPNSLANLRPAKPGEIRNPKGAGTSPRSIHRILKIIGERRLVDNPLIPQSLKEKFGKEKKLDNLTAVMELVYFYAIKGESWAVQFIAERTEGKVTEKIQIEEPTTYHFIIGPDKSEGNEEPSQTPCQ
jgi:hypothetical protein